jgi:four helix bundle protein
MKDFRDLLLWHNCRHLILELFQVTSTFPERELNGLANQIRKTCVAITSNIGMAFKMTHELRRSDFLNLAISSAEKLEIDLYSAKEKKLLNSLSFEHFSQEINQIKEVLLTLTHKASITMQFEPH